MLAELLWFSSKRKCCLDLLPLIRANSDYSDYPKLIRSYYIDKKTPLTAKERYRLNLVMCVYWTCLQLESLVALPCCYRFLC